MTATASAGPATSGAAAWETVVGLEVHCELATATKLFCGCRNAFGDEPNTNVCPVCLGLPGSLPVLNRAAVELAMRVGAALNSEVRPSSFHRKNYFYPDMPKNYQVSQYDEPINVGGWLDLPDGSRVGIVRAHLEEDTGKTTHVGAGGRIHAAESALVDYNRAGVPLVEIVSAPDIRSAEAARAYVNELRAILAATGVSDARMEEGSLRVDANVSVRPAGSAPEVLGTRAEIKNLNSVRSLGRAIDHEAARQAALLEAGGRVVQETRHWDEAAGVTHSLRSKEEAQDYRYFPEPDLVPLAPSEEWQAEVRASLPVLPAARRARLAEVTGLAPDDVAPVVEAGLDALVEAAVAAGLDARLAVNRAVNEVAGRSRSKSVSGSAGGPRSKSVPGSAGGPRSKAVPGSAGGPRSKAVSGSAGGPRSKSVPGSAGGPRSKSVSGSAGGPRWDSASTAAFVATLRMEAEGKLTPTQAKAVLARVLAEGGQTVELVPASATWSSVPDPAEVARELGFEALPAGALEAAVVAAVAAHPSEWERYRGGEDKLAGFFVGKVMAATRGQADGRAVTGLLLRRREAGDG